MKMKREQKANAYAWAIRLTAWIIIAYCWLVAMLTVAAGIHTVVRVLQSG